jgi:hypothetical protein
MQRSIWLLLALAACGGGASAGPRAAEPPPLLPWLAGSWRAADGNAVEHWTRHEGGLVGVGFGVSDGATRSFEVMTVTAEGTKLVFTARPQGGSPVAFPEESRGASWIVFANPQHDYPQKVAYRGERGRLVAHIEGAGKKQDWILDRQEAPRVPEIERAAAARGDVDIRASAASPAGDVGFSIARGPSGGERVTIWRRGSTWSPAFDLALGSG